MAPVAAAATLAARPEQRALPHISPLSGAAASAIFRTFDVHWPEGRARRCGACVHAGDCLSLSDRLLCTYPPPPDPTLAEVQPAGRQGQRRHRLQPAPATS
eukprot:35139-Chlamydomonas_euryale.AAC.9